MSRSADRSSRAHLAAVPAPRRDRDPGLQGLRRAIGHAAATGDLEHLERVAASDQTLAKLMRIRASERKRGMQLILATLEAAKKSPRARRQPSPDERVKIDWTAAFTERFLREAPRSVDDKDLCRRLGLPECCRGSMRAARSRHGILRPASADPRRRQPAPMAMAA